MTDWAIPQQAKLRYTQLFNLHDRNRSGFLSGLQCRDILLQSGLPRNVLAEIWNLSDIDCDGQLTREEFILAMHLTNNVRSGQTLPAELAPDLIPPSYRRTRSISTTSVASEGSSVSCNNDDKVSLKSSELSASAAASILNSNSFEDKRRENFERGRAELERRRLKIIEQQISILKEQLVTVKKQVTEAKTKIDSMRTERDTKMGTITTLEAQLKTLQDRKAYLSQEELNLIAIAKDLNLVNPAQAELDHIATQAKQESINQMKKQLEEFIKEKEVKSKELVEVNSRLAECKEELATLSEAARKAFESYEEKVSDAKSMREKILTENATKTVDLDSIWDSEPSFVTPNSQLDTTFMSTNDDIWAPNSSNDQAAAFNTSSITSDKDFVANSNPSPPKPMEPTKDRGHDQNTLGQMVQLCKRYRALYAFEARNPDELTISPGDVIVGSEVVTEPGWLSGESNGQAGLFPEAYVELITDQTTDTVKNNNNNNNNNNLPEETSTIPQNEPSLLLNELSELPPNQPPLELVTKYRVVYAFEARNPDELSMNPGDIIIGIEGAHEPGWLMGDLNGQKGLFPEAYVEKINESVQEQPGSGAKLQRISSVGSLRSKKSRSKRAEVATVIANYRAFGQEQLNLEKGQLVLIRRKMDSGWWEGETQVKDVQPERTEDPNIEFSSSEARGELAHLIDELVNTERDYIIDLRLCRRAYLVPLSELSFDVSQIFINWDELIEMHESSLAKLSENVSYSSSYYHYVFKTFQTLFESLVDLYVESCSKQSDSVRKFEAKIVSDVRFRQLVNECERNLEKSLNQQVNGKDKEENARVERNSKLPITSFLLKPIQRITKYSLLFDRIVKAIEKDGPEELEDLSLKLRISAQLLCTRVNEACRMKEDLEDNKRKLRWAQAHIKQSARPESVPDQQSKVTEQQESLEEIIIFDSKTKFMGDRKFIKAGSCFKWKSGKELVIFLFNDLLLPTQVKRNLPLRAEDVFLSSKAQQCYYRLHRKPIALDDLIIHEQDKNASNCLRSSWNEQLLLLFSFTDKSSGYIYNLIACTAQERTSWESELDKIINEHKVTKLKYLQQQVPQQVRKPNLELCFGRLFITIVNINQSNSSDPGNFSPQSLKFQDILITSRLYITLQLKKSMVVDFIEEKKDLIPISDLYRTAPLICCGPHRDPVAGFNPIENEEVLVQMKDETTQVLLEGRVDDIIPNILEINLIDDSKFRETQLLFKRRININQLVDLESRPDLINMTEKSNSNRNLKIQPNRPVELMFRLKSASSKFNDRRSSRASFTSSIDSPYREQPNSTESIKLNVRMRFHLHMF